MKITKVRAGWVVKAFDGRFRNSRQSWQEKGAFLVFIETDGGLRGIGECWCEGGLAHTLATFLTQNLAPVLIGADPCDRERLWARVRDDLVLSCNTGLAYAAWSGVDIALWDLLGQMTGLPIHKLLGRARDRVPVYASSGMYGEGYTPERLAEDMSEAVAAGFEGVKIKVAGAPLMEDMARVAAVREAIGPDRRLMADALFTLTLTDALRLCRALEPHDLTFLEGPFPPTDLDNWARLAKATPIPLAGPEIHYDPRLIRDYVTDGVVHFLQVDPVLCGGITETLRIGALAERWGLPVSLHSSSSAVAMAACLHLGAALPRFDAAECHLMHRILFDDVTEETFDVSEGMATPPGGPGLGLRWLRDPEDSLPEAWAG